MKKKLLRALALACLVPCILTACGRGGQSSHSTSQTADSGAEPVASTGIKVGISLPDKASSRWKTDGDLLSEKLRTQGYEPVVAYAASSADQQVSDLNALLSDGCELLIVAPVDADGLTAPVNAAKEAGVPVISLADLIRGTDGVTKYVAFDDYQVGQLEARAILDGLGLKESDTTKAFTLEFAAGDRSDVRQGFYYNGAYDVLQAFIDDGVFRTLSGEGTFSDAAVSLPTAEEAENQKSAPTVSQMAQERMKKILSSAYPDATQLDAVLCTDDEAASGVTAAVSAGYSGKNQVIITGSGANEGNLASIVDGKQTMTVFLPTKRLDDIAASLADSLLKGELPDATLIDRSGWDFECRYDTESYDNGTGILPAYLAAPVEITAKNIEKELVETGYFEMSGKYPKKVE